MNNAAVRTPFSLYRIFRAPLLVAALTTAGLIAALIGDGIFDVLSWLTLAAPLWVIWRKLASAMKS